MLSFVCQFPANQQVLPSPINNGYLDQIHLEAKAKSNDKLKTKIFWQKPIRRNGLQRRFFGKLSVWYAYVMSLGQHICETKVFGNKGKSGFICRPPVSYEKQAKSDRVLLAGFGGQLSSTLATFENSLENHQRLKSLQKEMFHLLSLT